MHDHQNTEPIFSLFFFGTHLGDHGVGAAEVEGAGPLEVAALDLEVAGLLCAVRGQEDVQLRPQLDDGGFLGREEQVARARAVPSEHFPSVVHAKYLMMHKGEKRMEWYDRPAEIAPPK